MVSGRAVGRAQPPAGTRLPGRPSGDPGRPVRRVGRRDARAVQPLTAPGRPGRLGPSGRWDGAEAPASPAPTVVGSERWPGSRKGSRVESVLDEVVVYAAGALCR